MQSNKNSDRIFSGNIYIFHAFDVGEDINLDKIATSHEIILRPLVLPKYFKQYDVPLEIELPHPHSSAACDSVKIHNFGAISLTYKIPFQDSLENVRKDLDYIDNKFQEQSVIDAGSIIKKIKSSIKKPNFFHTKSSYLILQLNSVPDMSVTELKQEYGSLIASSLRFETEQLSEYQRNDILNSAVGYFKGDLIVIDTDAAFIYDQDYQEILSFFEFANIQHLELRYFDRLLDQQLNTIYEERVSKVPLSAYLPFIGSKVHSPIDELGRLKVDISVITERLEGGVKLAGEPFYSALYQLLVDKLDLQKWKDSIQKKLEIIHEVRSLLQHKIETARGDMLEVLIIILIFIELVLGILGHVK